MINNFKVLILFLSKKKKSSRKVNFLTRNNYYSCTNNVYQL